MAGTYFGLSPSLAMTIWLWLRYHNWTLSYTYDMIVIFLHIAEIVTASRKMQYGAVSSEARRSTYLMIFDATPYIFHVNSMEKRYICGKLTQHEEESTGSQYTNHSY